MSVAEQKVLRDWRDNYGQPVVQVTVRNQTTKDNVGTLPLYSYTRPQPTPQPTPQPLSFSFPSETTVTGQDGLNYNADLLFSTRTVLAVKPNIAGITQRSVVSTPFCLGVAAEDIQQDQHTSHLPNIYMYLPSKKNIFLFERAHQVDLPKEAVGLVLESVVITSSAPETIVLTEEIYEGVVNVFREARDLCVEGDENITHYATEDDSDDDSNSVVCADSVALSTICTSRGRSIRPPTRLDL